MRGLCLAALASWAALGSVQPLAAQPAPVVERFALVIGNNHPDRAQRATLRYADDDAFAMHALFREAGVDSTLLTTPDEETTPLVSGVPRRPASLESYRASATQLTARLTAARARGSVTELFLFYSGHGEEDAEGEGYVMLEGQRRLTRSMLQQLLRGAGAARNHVIIDACFSGAMVVGRGRGGKHTPYEGPAPALSLLTAAPAPNTGYILSSSATGESHEWGRFRAGVLTHELRSALRGAADLDHDRVISYREASGFLVRANERVLPHLRPRALVLPPGGGYQEPLFAWSSPPALELGGAEFGHLYIETDTGVRVADLHPAPERQTFVWVPASRPLYVKRVDEQVEYAILDTAPMQRLDPSAGRATAVSSKGAYSDAFSQLFAAPFVAADLERMHEVAWAVPPSDERSARDVSPSHTATWIAASATLALGASAAVFGVLADAREARGDAVSRSCQLDCMQAVLDAQGAGPTFATLTNVSLALFGVSAAAALTSFVLESRAAGASTQVSLSPSGVRVAGAF